MTATVRLLLKEIKALSEEDRLALDQALARDLDKEWKIESGKARSLAKKRGIGMAEIDQAIAHLRYGTKGVV